MVLGLQRGRPQRGIENAEGNENAEGAESAEVRREKQERPCAAVRKAMVGTFMGKCSGFRVRGSGGRGRCAAAHEYVESPESLTTKTQDPGSRIAAQRPDPLISASLCALCVFIPLCTSILPSRGGGVQPPRGPIGNGAGNVPKCFSRSSPRIRIGSYGLSPVGWMVVGM